MNQIIYDPIIGPIRLGDEPKEPKLIMKKMKVKSLMKKRGVSTCEYDGCNSSEGLTIDHKIPKAFLKHICLSHLAEHPKNKQIYCEEHNNFKSDKLDLIKDRETVNKLLDLAQKMQENEKEVEDLF